MPARPPRPPCAPAHPRRHRRASSLARAALIVLAGIAFSLVPGAATADSPLLAAARAVAHDLGAPPPGSLVVASPLTSDVVAPRGDELTSRVASLVASALGGDARAAERPMALGAARTRAHAGPGRATALVYLDVRVDGGELRVTADVYPVVGNTWDRLRASAPPPLAHAYVHAPVAAEVRSYLQPLQLDRARVSTFTHDLGPVLAVACGALEGGGGNRVALVSAREVAWGYLEAGRFVVVRRAPSTRLGRRAPVPLREPLATAQIAPGEGEGTLYVGWGDRVGASLGPDLVARAPLAGLPVQVEPSPGCVLPDAARGGFEGGLVRCDDGAPLPGRPAPASTPALVDAWASLDLADAEGREARFVATRDPSGVVRLSRGAGEGVTLSDAGAQLALGDLDQDGLPELVTTLARGDDALVISTWKPGGLEPRLRLPAPRGVDAVAVCPPEADDAPSVVAVVGPELWLVR